MPERAAPVFPVSIVTRRTAAGLVTLLAAALLCVASSPSVLAHPEDEFCVPGERGLDPALCRALAALDSGDSVAADDELEPLLDELGNVRGFGSTLGLYVTIGVRHILPDGLDHILFVLALFLASTRARALLIQITTFTIAHTVTLGLAATGFITPSSTIVEPFIAFTIAFVAIENLLFKEMTNWRPLIVFAFGLVHGLGFAGFFGELGLPPNQFLSALIGFNIGVEVGQLSVVGLAVVLGLLLRRRLDETQENALYRRYVVVPGSALIGAVGLWWAIERLIASN